MWVKKCVKKSYIWNPAKCACENCKFFGSIIDNSVTCDKILERTKSILTKTTPTKIIPTHFSVKRWSVKLKVSLFYLPFY